MLTHHFSNMLHLLPTELTCCVLQYLHVVDIASLADAVMPDRSMYDRVTLPCFAALQPILSTRRRRAHFEMFFGQAQNFTAVEGQEVWDPAWANELLKLQDSTSLTICRRMRHEHSTAFLRLDETLRWLPPADDIVRNVYNFGDHLTEFSMTDIQMLHAAASRHELSIPASFLKCVSNEKLMVRLPYSFWLPERCAIGKASDVITNGQDGYLIDFCHGRHNRLGMCVWSLWLEPHGSHCVVRRQTTSREIDVRDKPAAELVGTSFEMWLADAFYSHWRKCGVDFCSDAHWWLDQPLIDCLSRYVQYNCLA